MEKKIRSKMSLGIPLTEEEEAEFILYYATEAEVLRWLADKRRKENVENYK